MNDRFAFIAFILISGFASLANLLARVMFDLVTSYEISIILAFPVGLITAFVLNRMFVFKPAEMAWHGQLARFLLVNLLMLVQIFLISMLFARLVFPAIGMTFHPETAAHAIGLVSPIFTSFWAHKHFTFKTAPAGRADTGQPQ